MSNQYIEYLFILQFLASETEDPSKQTIAISLGFYGIRIFRFLSMFK